MTVGLSTTDNTLQTFSDRVSRPARLLLAVYWPLLAVLTHWPKLPSPPTLVTGFQTDKIIHTTAFALLTGLIIYAQPLGPRRRLVSNALLGVLIAGAYALVDEYTQQWFWRTVSLADLIANAIGVIGAFLIVLSSRSRSASELTQPKPALPVWIARGLMATALPLVGWLLISPRFASIYLPPPYPQLLQNHADDVAHFLIALVSTLLLAAAAPFGRSRPALNAILIIPLIAAMAPIVEITQLRFHRGFEYADIFAHELGLATAVFLWAAGAYLRHAGAPDPDPQPDPSTPTTALPPPAGRFVAHALLVSVLTFISRVLGLVRDAVLAACFGMTTITDAFWIGFIVPNLFRRLFGEGALSAAFIPVYSKLLHKDKLTAKRLASLTLAISLIALGTITLIGELVLNWLLYSYDWSTDTYLAIRLTIIMLPYMPLVCLAALLAAILQVHGRFGPPAAAPILLNITMICVALLATWGMKDGNYARVAIRLVAASVLIAGVLQVAWQAYCVLGEGALAIRFTGAWLHFRAILATMLPMVIGLAVFQINTLFDSLIAWVLSPKSSGITTLNFLGYALDPPIRVGALTALQFAQRLYQFPVGVFGVALATAIFPALAHAAATKSSSGNHPPAQFRTILQQGLRLAVFIGLPASVGLIIVRVPLTRLIFQRGQFTTHDSLRVAWILMGYASAVWAYTMTHVLTRAFYALKDARTPLRISLAMVALNLVLNLTLIWPLGAAALAWSTAIAAACQTLLLLKKITRHLQSPVDKAVWSSWSKSLLLTTVMAAALAPLTYLYDPLELTHTHLAIFLAVLVALGSAIILTGAKLIRAEELTWLINRRSR